MNRNSVTEAQVTESASSRVLHQFTNCLHTLHESSQQYDCLHGEAPQLHQWTAASLVLIDHTALDLCLIRSMPERAGVVLVTSSGAASKPWADAARLGVESVLELPRESRTLTALIASKRAALSANYKLLVLLGRIIWP
ncbi:hypothetical protein [Nocardia sp. NRRL S-836]|uniref:hypothetical protein n=1 Tax=Nocardia sp. NRRL S-836 TaxID=1519492 RepID=UPI0006AF6587|nr:hypothetical protein [Nocardia sp. NRRL S-836]